MTYACVHIYSESLAHRLSLAAEFGLEMEEEDRPMYEFAQKLQVTTNNVDAICDTQRDAHSHMVRYDNDIDIVKST
jgi:hypothetical protein